MGRGTLQRQRTDGKLRQENVKCLHYFMVRFWPIGATATGSNPSSAENLLGVGRVTDNT